MSWDNQEKPKADEGGWDYNEQNLNYDEDIDPDSNLPVKYNSLGTAQEWTNQNKN